MSETEIGILNEQMVGVRDGDILVMFPATGMTKAQALTHAAWLVALADDHDDFAAVLKAVRNT